MIDITNANECRTCQILKESLEYERARNRELLETLTTLLKPVPVITQETTNILQPARPAGITFTRRRQELEKADRIKARDEQSPFRAKPDAELVSGDVGKAESIKQLEQELGVVEASGTTGE